ncbi:MAG: hypothetical protein AB7U66_20140, partial [Hyphomicrobiaceae bacterium]
LQRYKDGGLVDAKVYARDKGLTWLDPAGRTFTLDDLGEWLGTRGQAGRLAPKGFPRSGRFGPRFP